MKILVELSQIHLMSSENKLIITQSMRCCFISSSVLVNDRVTDLSGEGPHFGEEGFLGEVHDVVLCVLSLHYCTAVCRGQLKLLTPRAYHQLGVLILQPA